MKTKDTTITIKCSTEHKKMLKTLAEQEGCTMSDLLISKTLNIPLEGQPEVKHYTTKKGYLTIKRKVLPKGE